MKEIILARDARLALRSQAHHLDPVVLLGANGLTDAVLKEIDRELNAHELIKVRIPTDDREERQAIYAEIAEQLGCARVQMIGKLVVLWRPADENDRENADEAARVAILAMKTASIAGKKEEPRETPKKRVALKAESKKKIASKKPGEKKKRVDPTPRRARPKHKRLTKKAALSH